MTVTVGSKAAGRYGTGAVGEILLLNPKQETEKERLGMTLGV